MYMFLEWAQAERIYSIPPAVYLGIAHLLRLQLAWVDLNINHMEENGNRKSPDSVFFPNHLEALRGVPNAMFDYLRVHHSMKFFKLTKLHVDQSQCLTARFP